MKNVFLISFIMAFLLVLPLTSSLNRYSVPFYVSNQTTTAKNPTFSFIGLTANELKLNFDCNAYISGIGDSVCSYYAPLNNLIATSETSAIGDCVNFGQYEYQNVQNIDNVESSYFLTSSASSFYTKVKTDLIVESNDDYLIFYQDLIKDDVNHVKNFLSDSEQREQAFEISLSEWINLNMNTYNNNLSSCLEHNFEPLPIQSYSWACDGGGTGAFKLQYYIRLFPFNSSYSGLINYNISFEPVYCSVMLGGSCETHLEIGYFEVGESKTILSTSSTQLEGSLSLTPERDYVFYIAKRGKAKGTGVGVFPSCKLSEGDYNLTEFNITIITPDWNCSEWSDCLNGSQYRLCNDLTGKVKDKLENRLCYVVPEKSVYLGFEDYRTTNVWYNLWGWGCIGCDSETKEVLYPDGWIIENPKIKVLNKNNRTALQFDFLKMTSETAYEGDKSLKMWNIPPQLRIPEVSNFIELINTYFSSWIESSDYSNEGWLNPENAFSDNDFSFATGEANENISYKNFDFSFIPDTCSNIINLTVRLDTNKGGSPDTVVYDCIKVKINNTWSECRTIPTLTVGETTYLRYFGTFANNYCVEDLNGFEVRLELSSGVGDVELDYIAVEFEIYNPDSLSFYENILCGNQTIGIFPDIYKEIDTDENISIFVEKNITLPTPYMSTSFKIKKCIEPELKFYSTPICLDFYDHCYTHDEDCNYESKGTITYYLKDAETGEFLYDIKSEVIYPNKWEIREYAIDSLQPNKVYTIGFAVIPESTVDSDYYCIYLDDVNIDIRNIPLVCASECDNSDEIRRYCKEYDELGFCVVCEQIVIINSPNCLTSDSVINKVESCEDWCGCEEYDIGHSDYHTKYIGSIIEGCNITLHGIDKCCEYTETENSEYCIEFCEEWVEQGEGKLDEPLSVIADRFDELGIPEWSGKFFSPIMIIFYIILIIMAILTYITKSWEFGVITGLILMMVLGTLFIELLWIVILIIIVAGFILAKTIIPKFQQ